MNHYIFIPQAQSCGGSYTSESGSINSPNNPSNYPNYPNYAECNYVINLDGGPDITSSIAIHFNSFSTEGSYDNLTYGIGVNPGENMIGSFDGAVVPGDFVLNSDQVWFRFVSDIDTVSTGFSLSWSRPGENML